MPDLGFVPPPYPYDRLDEIRSIADAHEGGAVDLSIGTPCDPPPEAVRRALADSDAERGYPPSVGSVELRSAAVGWLHRRFGVEVAAGDVAACIGTKELVAGLPHLLRLRDPSRDTVLYPAVSYPTYEMGAILAGCRPVSVAVDEQFRLDLDAIDPEDRSRALCLWVNTPANPTGALDDLAAAVAWARANDVLLVSDECYIEFTWATPYGPSPAGAPGRTVLEHGGDGLLAVHSLSKRSNLAGLRAGFYAGASDLVRYLSETRKHLGAMVPGPVQAAAAVAFGDDDHVDAQRARYQARLARMADILNDLDIAVGLPDGGFYLWVAAPDGDSWAMARRLAERIGIVVSPGEFYGDSAPGYVRLALVAPDDRLDLVEARARS